MEAKYKEDKEECEPRVRGRMEGLQRKEGGRFPSAGAGTSRTTYQPPIVSNQRQEQFHGNVASLMALGVTRLAPRMFDMPLCNQCGRRHGGECRCGLGVCLKCGQPSHSICSCPSWNTGAKPSSLPIPPSSVQSTRSENRSMGRGGRGRGRGQRQNQPNTPTLIRRGQGRILMLNQQDALTPLL